MSGPRSGQCRLQSRVADSGLPSYPLAQYQSGTCTTPCTGLTWMAIGGSGTAGAMTTAWLSAVPQISSTAPATALQVSGGGAGGISGPGASAAGSGAISGGAPGEGCEFPPVDGPGAGCGTTGAHVPSASGGSPSGQVCAV